MKSILEKIGRHKKIVIALVAVLIIAVTASVVVSNAKEKQKAMMAEMSKLETEQIEKRTLVESISATGTVTSTGSKSVTTDVTGVDVLEVNVEVGDTVNEGDILCTLDTTELELDLADAQTSLNATQGTTNIKVSEAERSLSEAEESRDINLERADEDVADAWNDYLLALTDLEEAEDAYNDAQAATISKSAEYELSKTKLAEAETAMNNAAAGSGKGSTYETQFSVEVKALQEYIKSQNLTNIPGALDKLYISNTELQTYTASSIVDSAAMTADQTTAIDGYLGTLKGYQTAYLSASPADAAYQQAQAEYQTLQAETTEWQTKYNSAKQTESSCESAYEQAITAANSKLDAYNQQVRSKEDTVRNSDSTVSTQESSLASTKISATTSGTSEKKQIRQYEDQIEACTVTAPMSGVITEVNVEAGDSYAGTTIVTIEDTSAYEVTVEISEYDINKVEVGQQVVIKTNATGEEELKGTVKEIAPRATEGSSEVTYTVITSIDTPCDALKMDMTAKLGIILESKENVLTVPYDAVQEDEEGNYYIEVVSEDTTAVAPENATEMPEDAQMPEGEAQTGETSFEMKNKAMPGGAPDSEGMPSTQTKRIIITKGIESDYYIEVISDEVTEGMEVVIPATEGTGGFDIQNMMQRQGPMGGF